MKDKYAETDIVNKIIRIRESVYLGASKGNTRDRFTIAHEIGHFILHSYGGFSLCRSIGKIKSYENPEWQANTFAAEFLVETTQIKGMSLCEISKKYGVSKEVARIQLNSVK